MSTPSVQTSYADGSGNTVRLASRTYPDGRVVSVDYGTTGGVNDLIGRVAALVDDDDTPLAEYQYLGLGAVVQQDSPEADLRYTLVNPAGTNDPDTGDIYSGLDRFGRVKDVRWRDVSADSDLSRVQYGYDRAGNRTFRRNPSDTANHHDWLYGYDGLHRLQDAGRGTLVSSGSQPSTLNPQLFVQCWTLDPTGNWQGFRQADSGDPWDLVQARLANPVNEITGITNSTGPAWAQPAYDAAGNMTTIPQPADPTASYTATYDAWNRLVKLVDPATGHTVQENEYDGRAFRTVRKSYTAGVLTETRHFYYTDGWRDVEERLGTSPDTADPDRQFVWGIRYIDDLVLRDRNDAGTLDERLYALQDANWNVTAVVDDAGAVQERYEYDPYGQLTVLSPAFVVRAASSFGWETTYAGYRFDVVTGIYVVRFRVLAPVIGWLQRDPLGYASESLTLYGYVLARPLAYDDPYGLIGSGNGLYLPGITPPPPGPQYLNYRPSASSPRRCIFTMHDNDPAHQAAWDDDATALYLRSGRGSAVLTRVRNPDVIPAVVRQAGCCEITLIGHRGGLNNAGIVTDGARVIPNDQLAVALRRVLAANGCSSCTINVFSCQLSADPQWCANLGTTPAAQLQMEDASFSNFACLSQCTVNVPGTLLNTGTSHTCCPGGRSTPYPDGRLGAVDLTCPPLRQYRPCPP